MMKAVQKFIAIVLSAVFVVAMFAGCMPVDEPSSAPAASTPDSSPASSDAPATDNAEPVTLRMSWWGNDARHKGTLDAIDAYMALNPHVTVDAEYGGKDGYHQKYATQLAGGNAPEILTIDQPWVAEFYNEGDFFVDLYQYDDLLDLSQFDPQFLIDYHVMDGKLIGMPAGVNGMTYMLDSRLQEELGEDFSGAWDWQRLHDVGVKVNQNDPEQYFLVTDSMFLIMLLVRPYLSQLAGTCIINDDYTPAFTEADLTEVLALVRSLYEDKVIEPCQDADLFLQAPSTNPKWIEGDFRGTMCWLTSMSSAQPFGDYLYNIEFPQAPGSTNSGILVRPVQIYSVPKSTANVEEAVKFLDFMLNDETAAECQGNIRSFPASAKALEVVMGMGIGYEAFDNAFEYAKAHSGTPENGPSGNTEIEAALRGMVESVAYNKGTTEQIAKDGYAQINEILSRLKP